MIEVTLFDYWRSSASYRVRIALSLAGIDYTSVAIDLAQRDNRLPGHIKRNPQGFVPVLDIDGHRFTQSLAILDYLDATRNLGLLPEAPPERAKVLALAHILAVDVHPVCNLSVINHVAGLTDGKEGIQENWMVRFILKGLKAFEISLGDFRQKPFCCGATVSLADICLMPQIYNAERWDVGYSDLPRINRVVDVCMQHPAFIAAFPTEPG